jgi:hypothetical protein
MREFIGGILTPSLPMGGGRVVRIQEITWPIAGHSFSQSAPSRNDAVDFWGAQPLGCISARLAENERSRHHRMVDSFRA